MTGDVLAQIEAVLQQVENRTEHSPDCRRLRSNFKSLYPVVFKCNCDRGARVLQDQARTVERREFELRHALTECLREMIRAAKSGYTGADDYHEAIRDGEAVLVRTTEQGEK